MAGIPTIESLFERLKLDIRGREELKEVYRRVACGERKPNHPKPLPDSAIIFACQAMVILFEHVDTMLE